MISRATTGTARTHTGILPPSRGNPHQRSTEGEDRQVRSIHDQLAELRELARKEGLTVVDELTESQTAKEPGRPVFNRLLDCVEQGEADGILAWHPDRLARNSVDGGRLIYLVDIGKVRQLKFPTFWFDPTPQGKFMLAIAFGQSKYYVDNLSENIRRGQRQKLKDGIWPMIAPVGYLNDRRTRTIAPDPERGPLVRKGFELYATGEYTLDRLTRTLSDLGLTTRRDRPLSRARLYKVLQQPIYCGIIRYGGELYEGKHEPLITKDLFDAVQRVMQQKSKPKEVALKPYAYRKVFRCGECSGYITTETQKGHNYLRCTKKKGPCSQRYVREEEVTRQVAAALDSIAPTVKCSAWLIAQSDADNRHASQHLRQRLSALETKLARADDKIQRLNDAYLEQALSLDEYRQMKNKLVEEKASLKGRTTELRHSTEKRLEPLARFLNSLNEATLLASTDKSVKKAKFLKKIGSNLTIQEKKVRCEFSGPWKIAENHGRFAHRTTAARLTRAAAGGETSHDVSLAERGRNRSRTSVRLPIRDLTVASRVFDSFSPSSPAPQNAFSFRFVTAWQDSLQDSAPRETTTSASDRARQSADLGASCAPTSPICCDVPWKAWQFCVSRRSDGMKTKLKHPIVYKTIINFETGESECVPEGKEERRARLARQRAARKATAFSRTALDDARTEALTEAWRRVYDGATMPIHYDLVLSSKGFTKTERTTLVDASFTENIFDPSQLVGSKNAVTLKRRPKTVPPDFVHEVKLG